MPTTPPPGITDTSPPSTDSWSEVDESDVTSDSGHKWKGKSKQLEVEELEGGARVSEERDESVSPVYPPITDEDAETRRVQENLRQWEIAERQRRKLARESLNANTSSIFGDVAGFFWSRRQSQQVNRRGDLELGKHAALASQEYLAVIPSENPPRSLSPSAPSSGRPSSETAVENPFADPPIADGALMSASSEPPSPSQTFVRVLAPEKPVLEVADAGARRRFPTPKPLGLPAPQTPPPRTDTATPVETSPERILDEDEKDARWWHDWLCGCNEGPERGGNYQAGRTNPFE